MLPALLQLTPMLGSVLRVWQEERPMDREQGWGLAGKLGDAGICTLAWATELIHTMTPT